MEQFFYERKKIRMLILKQANTKVIAALIVDILVDKKYVNEDETTTNRSRLANFLVTYQNFFEISQNNFISLKFPFKNLDILFLSLVAQ